MPAPCRHEFRDDVVVPLAPVRTGVTLAQIANDFGIHEMTPNKWMRRASIEDGGHWSHAREVLRVA
jgi:transposase